MGSSDRFNRVMATMAMLEEDGLNPVLAVRYEGQVHEFRIVLPARYLECHTSSLHPRAIIEDSFTKFVEGYPGSQVNRALADIW